MRRIGDQSLWVLWVVWLLAIAAIFFADWYYSNHQPVKTMHIQPLPESESEHSCLPYKSILADYKAKGLDNRLASLYAINFMNNAQPEKCYDQTT